MESQQCIFNQGHSLKKGFNDQNITEKRQEEQIEDLQGQNELDSVFQTNDIQQIQTFLHDRYKLNKLKQLKISNLKTSLNKIELLNEQNFNNLIDLDISRSLIKILPQLKMPKLCTIKLAHNQIQNIEPFCSGYYHCLKSLSLQNNRIKKLPVINAENLEILQFSCNQVQQIQQFRVNQYRKLEKVSLYYNWLTKISVLNWPKIKDLDFSGNDIQDITSFAVGNYQNLQSLNLMYNKIKVLPKLFTPKLLCLLMSSNLIQDINNFCQGTYESLNQLFLNNNCIKILPKLNAPQLIEISLINNQLQDVEAFSSQIFNKLSKVDFSINRIKTMPKINSVNINQINFRNNFIEELTQFATGTYPKLVCLNFGDNRISNIPQIHAPTLQQLQLNENKIQNFDSLSLSENNETKILFLNNNSIKQVFLFKNIKQVTSIKKYPSFLNIIQLHMKSNKISNIEMLFYVEMPSLELLELSDNYLTNLKTFKKMSFKQLHSFSAINNKFSSLQGVNFFNVSRTLKSFELESNLIYDSCLMLKLGTEVQHFPYDNLLKTKNNNVRFSIFGQFQQQ